MSSEASALAAALLDAAVLVERAGVGGLVVTCYEGRASVCVARRSGDTRSRAAVVAVLALAAGASGCQRHDFAGEHGPGVWLEASVLAGATEIGISTLLDARTVPGGALAAGPDGTRAVIAPGQELPRRWRWVTDLDDQPAPGCQEVA